MRHDAAYDDVTLHVELMTSKMSHVDSLICIMFAPTHVNAHFYKSSEDIMACMIKSLVLRFRYPLHDHVDADT